MNVRMQKVSTKKIVVIAMLTALTVVFGVTPNVGFIQLPLIKATIMHLPVIIGAIVAGPVVGSVIGLMFGLFSIVQNAPMPAAMSPFLLNPLVSVLPRVLIAITSYYTYRALRKQNDILAIGAGAVIGSLTNTIGVLGMIYILYAQQFAMTRSVPVQAVGGVILGIASTNGIIEATVALVLCTPVVYAVKKIYNA